MGSRIQAVAQIALADRIAMLDRYRLKAEVFNDKQYDWMSNEIMDLTHQVNRIS
jgi:hypothetical protein